MNGPDESWKAIPGYEGRYLISDLGRVRGRHGRETRTHKIVGKGCGYGHRRISLCGPNRTYRTFTLHRLVLLAFVGPRPHGMQACHNNGDASDNRAVNLRWDTAKANQADRHLHGTALIGSRHPTAKLCDAQVLEIRALARTDSFSNRDCCSKFGVSHATVSRIVSKQLWRHLP